MEGNSTKESNIPNKPSSEHFFLASQSAFWDCAVYMYSITYLALWLTRQNRAGTIVMPERSRVPFRAQGANKSLGNFPANHDAERLKGTGRGPAIGRRGADPSF